MMKIKDAALWLYFILRLPAIWCVKLFWRPRVKASEAGKARILIIRLDRLGDLVLTLPVIESLRRYYPEARISILVRPYLAGLAHLIGSIDEVIQYDGFIKTAKRLRSEKFSIAIDMLCDYSLRPALLAYLSGAPVRVGFEGGYRELLFTEAVRSGGRPRHMIEINLDLLAALGVPAVEKMPRLTLKGIEKGPERIIAIHPGGYYPSQRWPAEKFAEVGRRVLEAFDVSIVVLGGPDDSASVNEIIARISDRRARAVSVDLEGFALMLARASLLICNNSGPLHLAAALGVPTVSTMGPTDPVLWWPKGDNQAVVRKSIKCSPCSLGNCKEHLCMDLITVDEVFGEARKLLEKVYGLKG
jgi:lipopolysaccharide heptosyltransferase II